MVKLFGLVSALLAFSIAIAQSGDDLARHVYPMSRPLPCPKVTVDASDFPEGQVWGDAAKALLETWYPAVTAMLSTKDFKAPPEIKLIIKKTLSVPAYASGESITINGKWITDHPDDLGMVIHELTHVVQQYPNSRSKPGWLVEGIADYIRWWRYEPELHSTKGRTKINPERSKYTDSYRTTAMWLAWCSRTYDMRLVPALDLAMRKGDDPMPLFEKITGKSPDNLWKEFVAANS